MASNPKHRIQQLITSIEDDRRLLRELEAYEQEVGPWAFAPVVGTWARLLYDRDRKLFLPLIERHLNVWGLHGVTDLEGWLQQAAENSDNRVYRVLYQAWLADTLPWDKRRARWVEDLRADFEKAGDRADRADVLDRYDLGFELYDEDAVELYRIDPVVTEEWVRGRVERERWMYIAYEKLAEAAREQGSDDFFYFLYTRTFPVERWREDVGRLAEEVTDPAELNRELERRHFTGPESSVDPVGLIDLLQKRGEDVRPYLRNYIARCVTWGSNPAWGKLASLAAEREWWDVWSVTVRSQFAVAEFNEMVDDLTGDTSRPEWQTAALLTRVAGTQYGWGNWRRPIQLSEEIGLALYRRFPELARGPLFDHFRSDVRVAYAEVAAEASSRGDTLFVDMLTARAVTIGRQWSREVVDNVGWYVDHYDALEDPEFATRAIEVVARVEPFEFLLRNAIRKRNPLYGIFFRSVERYRPVADNARMLLESPCEETGRLALRMLTLDGVGAELAADNVDHLLAYLLNGAQRSTRIAAFDALVRAAQTEELAETICRRARETLDLRCRNYPRDRLVELIGRVIHRWPSLRTDREQPVIYDREAS